LQREARRYYSMNGNVGYGMYTLTSGHVSPIRRTNRSCGTEGRANLAQGFKKRYVQSRRHAPRRPGIIQMEFTKRASCFISTEIRTRGSPTKEPYAVHKAFLCRSSVRLRPLFARQFDTDLRLRPSQSWTSRKHINVEIWPVTKNQLYLQLVINIIDFYVQSYESFTNANYMWVRGNCI